MESANRKAEGNPREKLHALIREIEIGMLTTVRPDGRLHTRPMATRFDEQAADRLATLWFFTAEHTPKTEEIAADRHVSISYADVGRKSFVAVSGIARIVRDPAVLRRFWEPALTAWFPKGLEDPELALLRVDVRSGEYWDAPTSSMIEIIAAVQSGLENPPRVDVGDHARVRM